MKKRKWAVDKKKKIGWVIEFIKRYIKCEPHESVVGCLLHSLIFSVKTVIILMIKNDVEVIFYLIHRSIWQFLYVNQAFAPAPDVDVRTIYEVC